MEGRSAFEIGQYFRCILEILKGGQFTKEDLVFISEFSQKVKEATDAVLVRVGGKSLEVIPERLGKHFTDINEVLDKRVLSKLEVDGLEILCKDVISTIKLKKELGILYKEDSSYEKEKL